MIQVLSEQQLKTIYQLYMKVDFPPAELKPLSSILHQRKKQISEGLGFYHEGQLSGYAVVEHGRDSRCLLLDYFAILPSCRSQGLGSAFLSELKEWYSQWDALLIESETAVNETAARRLEFYQRAGARITAIPLVLFHVRYHCLRLNLRASLSEEETARALRQLYRTIYPLWFRLLFLRMK